jgi:quercetin dioxygenase-like cupin family protein
MSPRARPLPPRFRQRVVTLAPGDRRPFHEHEWDDSLVLVHAGELELECHRGGRRRFAAGSILWMIGLDLRAMHNPGDGPLVLVAISRRQSASS